MDSNFFKTIKILDGGMGQLLLSKGLITMGTLWSASAVLNKDFHQLLLDTHISYIDAGADVICTNTFSARMLRMIENKVAERFNYVNEKACELAIKAKELSKKNILVAGALPSQRDSYVEDIRTSNEIENDFLRQAKIICPYVDFVYLDVLSSGREIDIASNILSKFDKKFLVGVHLKKNGKLPSGETLTDIINKYLSNDCLGLVLACVSPEIVNNSINELSKFSIPFGFKANLWKIEEPTPQRTFNTAKYNETGTNPNVVFGSRTEFTDKLFFEVAKINIKKGATILGGCCETNPSHIKEISKLKQ